jgi:hypothetical protein
MAILFGPLSTMSVHAISPAQAAKSTIDCFSIGLSLILGSVTQTSPAALRFRPRPASASMPAEQGAAENVKLSLRKTMVRTSFEGVESGSLR